MISNLGTIAVALISWIVFNTIGKPLLRFFDLRTEVRRAMILYDNVRARWSERDIVRFSGIDDEDMTPDNFERLQDAENQYRDLASQIRAFADTQSPTCTVLRWIGFDARKASSGLIGLSNTINTYGKTRAFHKQTINQALKFPEPSALFQDSPK
jgi:hypothetical protein